MPLGRALYEAQTGDESPTPLSRQLTSSADTGCWGLSFSFVSLTISLLQNQWKQVWERTLHQRKPRQCHTQSPNHTHDHLVGAVLNPHAVCFKVLILDVFLNSPVSFANACLKKKIHIAFFTNSVLIMFHQEEGPKITSRCLIKRHHIGH